MKKKIWIIICHLILSPSQAQCMLRAFKSCCSCSSITASDGKEITPAPKQRRKSHSTLMRGMREKRSQKDRQEEEILVRGDDKFSRAVRRGNTELVAKMIGEGFDCDRQITYWKILFCMGNRLLTEYVLDYLVIYENECYPMLQLLIEKAGVDPTKVKDWSFKPKAQELLLKQGKTTQELLVKKNYLDKNTALLVRAYLTPKKLLPMLKKKIKKNV